jgi:hypothetical protein
MVVDHGIAISMNVKSWKTSLFGLLSAFGTSVILVDGLPPWAVLSAKICTAVGVAGMGLFARDNNVSSEMAGVKPVVTVTEDYS